MSGPEDRPKHDGPHNGAPDAELDDFLAGRGPHRARYEAAAHERTPVALDASVLAQARRAVAAVPRARRWRLPLSLAATLVLGFGLVSRLASPPAAPPAMQSAAEAQALLAGREPPSALAAAPPASADVTAPPVVKRRAPLVLQPQTRDAPRPPPSPPPPAEAAKAETQARAIADARREQAREQLAADDERARAARARTEAPSSPQSAGQAFAAPATAPADAAAEGVEPAWAPGRYRSAQGALLELGADGRFRLEAPSGSSLPPSTLSGAWRQDGDALLLLPQAAGCRLRLQAGEAALELRSGCGQIWAGDYRAAGR